MIIGDVVAYKNTWNDKNLIIVFILHNVFAGLYIETVLKSYPLVG